MNTVLTQELARFNLLSKMITGSMDSILKGLDGIILLSADHEAAAK